MNTSNLGNGWYPNRPPVTLERLQKVIDCMIRHGAPDEYTLRADPVSHVPGDIGLEPTTIMWKYQGRTYDTDAVLTFYGPRIALYEVRKNLIGLPTTAETLNALQEQVDRLNPAATVEIKDPIGAPWPERGSGFYRSSVDDQFIPGATFTDGRGKFVKRSGGFFFSRWSGWEKISL
jgi:hypothetical protein